MNYWEGYMDWPLADDWKCETCGENGPLEWGFVHAQCRCMNCHTEYKMRDKDQNVVNTPICQLKDEYKIPSRLLWDKLHIPLELFSDDDWDSVMNGEVTA